MEFATRDAMKAEALDWMQILKVNQKVIRDFRDNGTVKYCVAPSGKFLPLPDRLTQQVCDFENEHGGVVYLVVGLDTLYGHLDSLLFVTKYTEDWEYEKEDLADGYVMTYTINQDYTACSDMGSIVIKRTKNGGLLRTV